MHTLRRLPDGRAEIALYDGHVETMQKMAPGVVAMTPYAFVLREHPFSQQWWSACPDCHGALEVVATHHRGGYLMTAQTGNPTPLPAQRVRDAACRGCGYARRTHEELEVGLVTVNVFRGPPTRFTVDPHLARQDLDWVQIESDDVSQQWYGPGCRDGRQLDVYLQRGYALRREGQHADAISELECALLLDDERAAAGLPAGPHVAQELARTLRAAGRLDDELQLLRTRAALPGRGQDWFARRAEVVARKMARRDG